MAMTAPSADRGRRDAVRGSPRPSCGQLSLRLLDGFQLTAHGQVIDLPAPAQRVVAFAALNRRTLQRELVAEALWADRERHRASANLRSALWQLRAAPGAVEVTRCHLRLGDEVRSDLNEVQTLTNSILDDEGDVDTTMHLTTHDVDLLDRELLPGWFDVWATVERERVRQLCIGALEELSQRLRRHRRFALAVVAAMAAIHIEPMRETAHHALIEAHLEAGNRTEALRRYDDLRGLLELELGVSPSPALQARVASSLSARDEYAGATSDLGDRLGPPTLRL